MRFPRNTKIFRGQLDAAPYAGVFFLLALFLLLNSSFVFTPGVPIELPEAADLAGTSKPSIAVVVDESSRIYFENQVTPELALKLKFREAAETTPELTLVIQADKNVRWDTLARLTVLAREAGIKTALMATRPPLAPTPRTTPAL